jgi:4,5-dihydroxyphthalate decarboxylase
MVVVSKKLLETNPDAVRETFRLLKASKAKAAKPAGGEIDFCPFGLEALRKPLQAIVQYAAQQRLIPRAYEVEELFDETTRLLS